MNWKYRYGGSDLEKAPAAIPPVLEDVDDHSLGCAEGSLLSLTGLAQTVHPSFLPETHSFFASPGG
jgi:hypothetical protein